MSEREFASYVVLWAVQDSGYVGADASPLLSYASELYDDLLKLKSKKPMRYVRLVGVDEYGQTEVIW